MLSKEFITEDRVDYLAQQMGDRIMSAYKADNGTKPKLKDATQVLRYLEQASKKDINWIAKNYIAGKFKLEDVSKIKQEIDLFNKVKNKLPAEQRDLNKLTLSQLYDITDQYQEIDTSSNKEQQRQEKEKFYSPDESEVLYKSKDLVVLIPKTEEASCYFGKGTKWCTAATGSQNYFSHYNRKGPLYIIMTKDMGKFQFHFSTRQFMDSRDDQLNSNEIKELTSKYPELYKIFEKQAVKYLYLPLIKNPSEKVQLAAIKQDGYAIKFIKNPSEKVQLAAVNRNGRAICYIENPSLEIQLVAVKEYGFAIKYIQTPSLKVQLAAVNEDGRAIQYIKNPSEEVQLAAVNRNGRAIEYIKNPSEEVQLAAVNENGRAIEYINNPSHEVQLAAVNEDGLAIEYIQNPSEEVQLTAVKEYGFAIKYIQTPSLKVQLAAVNEDGLAIKFIKNPSEKVQLAAIKQNSNSFEYIRKPTPKVIAQLNNEE